MINSRGYLSDLFTRCKANRSTGENEGRGVCRRRRRRRRNVICWNNCVTRFLRPTIALGRVLRSDWTRLLIRCVRRSATISRTNCLFGSLQMVRELDPIRCHFLRCLRIVFRTWDINDTFSTRVRSLSFSSPLPFPSSFLRIKDARITGTR